MPEYRICRKCKIHHYENCPECYGFGVYNIEGFPPISAADAHDKDFKYGIHCCPFCGSTEKGLPIELEVLAWEDI